MTNNAEKKTGIMINILAFVTTVTVNFYLVLHEVQLIIIFVNC